jgi:16S rRNA (guanine966-N2)-methyltransferase
MRIISGTAKGKSIRAPKNLPARPTTDFCKESIFNILGTYLDFPKLKVLDLFAGTGNISLEFASRGCIQVIAVDLNYSCCDFIKNQSKLLKFENLKVTRSEVIRFLNQSSSLFDLIFADPPYDYPKYPELIEIIFRRELLDSKGWFLLEHSSAQDFNAHPHFKETRIYGQTRMSIFQN